MTLQMLMGFAGLIAGFIVGMAINAYLLRGVPREQYTKDPAIRTRFGLLNWGVALLGLALASMWQRWHG